MKRTEATAAQQTIVWGSHFVRHVPERFCAEFGRVLTPDEITGPGERSNFDAWMAADTYTLGERYVEVNAPDRPEPVRMLVNICELVPLTVEHYNLARDAGWVMSDIGATPEGRAALVAIWTDPRWEGDRS